MLGKLSPTAHGARFTATFEVDVSDTSTDPIVVKANAAPIVTQESVKALVIAGAMAYVVTHAHGKELQDQLEQILLPAAAVISTMALSAWQRVRTWLALRHLANQVPDSVAKVGK